MKKIGAGDLLKKGRKKKGKTEGMCKECTWIRESNTNGKDGTKEGGYMLEFSKQVKYMTIIWDAKQNTIMKNKLL